jgi:hypothetical protein
MTALSALRFPQHAPMIFLHVQLVLYFRANTVLRGGRAPRDQKLRAVDGRVTRPRRIGGLSFSRRHRLPGQSQVANEFYLSA